MTDWNVEDLLVLISDRRQPMTAPDHAGRMRTIWRGALAAVGRQLVHRARSFFDVWSAKRVKAGTDAGLPLAAPSQMSGLLAQAFSEDSNLGLDWLWYATQMHDVYERRYCLERAQHIYPQSAIESPALGHRTTEMVEQSPAFQNT
jgi:hypothetical protein